MTTELMSIDDRYLGDGVYASFDGYHVCLDLRGQDSKTHVALGPNVFQALVSFAYDAHAHEVDTQEGNDAPGKER